MSSRHNWQLTWVPQLLVLSLVFVTGGEAQSPTPHDTMTSRKAAIMAGGGSTFAGWGVLGELFSPGGRLSLVASIGYSPAEYEGGPAGVAGAIGGRFFTGGGKHRAFLELAFSQIEAETVGAGDEAHPERLWGPALQAGYVLTAKGGLTWSASVGAGYAVNEGVTASRWKPVWALGMGYTFR